MGYNITKATLLDHLQKREKQASAIIEYFCETGGALKEAGICSVNTHLVETKPPALSSLTRAIMKTISSEEIDGTLFLVYDIYDSYEGSNPLETQFSGSGLSQQVKLGFSQAGNEERLSLRKPL